MILELNPRKETESVKDDRPPPYSISEPLPSGERHTTFDSSPVNQVFISSRYKDLSGTFHIDPDLQVSSPFTCTKRQKPRKRKAPEIPNASFRTRHGAISLNLALSGSTTNITKANVVVTSRSGDITLNLLSGHPTKRINLNVRSKRGDIVLLIPKTFLGAIQLRSRKGSLTFLPAFARGVRLLKSDDNEALVLVGDTSLASANSSNLEYCGVTSRFGKITVGISGEDHFVAEAGIWKRLGGLLKGVGS